MKKDKNVSSLDLVMNQRAIVSTSWLKQLIISRNVIFYKGVTWQWNDKATKGTKLLKEVKETRIDPSPNIQPSSLSQRLRQEYSSPLRKMSPLQNMYQTCHLTLFSYKP